MVTSPQADEHLDSLRQSQQQSQQRAQTATDQLASFERSLNRVRGGDIADAQFDDASLQAQIDEYDANVAAGQRSYDQTTQYQQAAYGAYRLGARGGRRFLNEARQQISTDLLKIQNQARAQRAGALETYRRSKIEEQRQARRDAAAFGQQAYQVEEREEQKRIARNERYRQDFEQQLLAGKPLGTEFIAQFAESSGEKAEDIQKLVEQAGGAAISALKAAADKQGILIDEDAIDYNSNESAIQSIRDQMEYSRAQDLARKRREEQRKETKLDLDIAGHKLDREEFAYDKYATDRKLRQGDVRQSIAAARLELDKLRFEEWRNRGGGGTNLSREERDRIRALDTAGVYLEQINPEAAENENIQLVALGVADLNVGGRVRNEKAFNKAIINAIDDINKNDGGAYVEKLIDRYAPLSPDIKDLQGSITPDTDPELIRQDFLAIVESRFEDDETKDLNYRKLGREIIGDLEVNPRAYGPTAAGIDYVPDPEFHGRYPSRQVATNAVAPTDRTSEDYISPFGEYRDRYGTGIDTGDGGSSGTRVEVEGIPNSQQLVDNALTRYFGDLY